MPKRRYQHYSEEELQKCLYDIRNKQLSQREAASVYGIPRSAIKNKLKGLHGGAVGRATTFTDNEEKVIASRLLLCAEFGIPFEYTDIRIIGKYYLG